jgi:hypothetical protein
MKSPNDNGSASELGDLLTLPVVPATEYQNWTPDGFEDSERTAESPASTAPELNKEDVRFLQTVIGEPGKPSSVYAKIARMSGRRAISVRRHLVEMGYLREIKLNANRRGRASLLLEPTQKARRLYQTNQGEMS